jgi:hypothetical protein
MAMVYTGSRRQCAAFEGVRRKQWMKHLLIPAGLILVAVATPAADTDPDLKSAVNHC